MSLPKVEEILTLIAELSGVPVAKLQPTTSLTVDLGLDSVAALELVVDVEERLGMRFSDAALRDVRTIGDLQRVFLREIAASTAAAK